MRTTIRMPAGLLKAVEEVRNPEEFPALTDFIRRAVEHYVKELKRKKLTEECLRLAGEEDLAVWTEVDFAEHVERISRAERGELLCRGKYHIREIFTGSVWFEMRNIII